MTPALTVGAIAAAAGVRSSAVRYYDGLGLLPRSTRTPAGYRVFPAETVRRIAVIRAAQQLGFRLRDLAGFFHVRERGGRPCEDVRRAGEEALAALNADINKLLKRRARVRRTLRMWDHLLANTPRTRPAYLLEALEER